MQEFDRPQAARKYSGGRPPRRSRRVTTIGSAPVQSSKGVRAFGGVRTRAAAKLMAVVMIDEPAAFASFFTRISDLALAWRWGQQRLVVGPVTASGLFARFVRPPIDNGTSRPLLSRHMPVSENASWRSTRATTCTSQNPSTRINLSRLSQVPFLAAVNGAKAV